jgi:ATP-dependent DNA helicase RecG
VLLDYLRAKPDIGRKALAELLEITPDGVKYHINKLREAGMIRHVGDSRGGRWEIVE